MPGLRTWLVHPYRLTERLQKKAGEVALQVLAQTWLASNWLREVVIFAKGEACWYARTSVPKETYVAGQDFFLQLKTQSLGELIAASSTVERVLLRHYPISSVSAAYQWLPAVVRPSGHPVLWLRESRFLLQDQYPFYLTEIFLPPIMRYCE